MHLLNKVSVWMLLVIFLQANNAYSQIPNLAYDNLQNYNYTNWDENFLTAGIATRKFSNQTSSYNLNVNFTDLSIHSLNITQSNHSLSTAFTEANALTFATQYAGDINYAILQNGSIAYGKSATPTSEGNADSQMAEYGTWQNRRFISTNFTNAAPVERYFTGVEFTNWHNRFKITFHVHPTTDINNGQLQLSVDIPTAYSNYYTQGNLHAFALNSDEGFALKGGITAATTTATGNNIEVITAAQNLVANTSYEVSIIVYAIPQNLSTTYSTIDDQEAQVNITANQVLPNAGQNAVISYAADEGVHFLDIPRYSMGYTSCSQNEVMQDIDISLQNTTNTDKRVRLCFRQIPNVNVVGFNSLIRNVNGDPSGLPLQVSKNWHNGTLQLYSGSWIREYTEIVVPANTTIPFKYTRTGAKWGETYGAFSHQLSVVGSGVPRGGWLEAGLGSFGENVTHSPDYLFGRSNVCDVRPFLVTNGNYGGTSSQCSWTGNVGGMDMWVYTDANDTRVYQSEVKTRFQRYSPNLTETSVSAYSSDKKLKLDYTFYLNRSDDFTRIYYKVKVKALQNADFTRFDIFQLGGDNYNVHHTQSLVYGNDQGMLGQTTPINSGSNDYTTTHTALPGRFPWLWAGDGMYTNGYGGINLDTNNGLIIHSYAGTFGGVSDNTPYFRERSSSTGFAAASGLNPTSYCIVPPPGVSSWMAGDSVEILLETMILPKQDGDYYGTNTNFADALATYGNSWKLLFREVLGIPTATSCTNNVVNSLYPINVETINNTALVSIEGGKGYVPVVFEGLTDITDPILWRADDDCWEVVDQSNWGKDFWQADYNTDTGLFDLIYNVNQDTPDDQLDTIRYYLGDTPPIADIIPQAQVGGNPWFLDTALQVQPNIDNVSFAPQVNIGGSTSPGVSTDWLWTAPDGSTYTGRVLDFSPVMAADEGIYTVTYDDGCRCAETLTYVLCTTLPTNIVPQSNYNNEGWSLNTLITGEENDQVLLAPQVTQDGVTSVAINNNWTWTGPNGFTYQGRVLNLSINSMTAGVYVTTYTNECGTSVTQEFIIALCATIDLDIRFDGFPGQTSWEITDVSGNVVASSGTYSGQAGNSQLSLAPACLPDGCYDLTFNDALNNGMCPFRATASSQGTFITPGTLISPGSVVATLGTVVSPGLCGNYQLYDADGNLLASGGGGFGASETNNFCLTNGTAQRLVQDYVSQDARYLEVYPVPASKFITIYHRTDDDAQVKIIDINGRILQEYSREKNADPIFTPDISRIPTGVNFVQLITTEGVIITKKFVKQ